MKTLLALTIGCFAAAFLSQSSFAGPERLEAKEIAPAPAPPSCDWTGFYVGVHVGFGSGDSIWEDVNFGGSNTELGHQSHEGVFGGGQLGYNFQFGHFVIGAEGDFAYSDVGGEHLNRGRFGEFFTINTDNDWTGTVAARLGYAFAHNRVLAYVKGGAAFSHWNYNFVTVDPSDGLVGTVNTFNTDDTRITPMVGAGVEFAITCRWSAKLEARYVFLGKDSIVGTKFESAGDSEPDESYQVDLRQVSAQAGLNYKFSSFGSHDGAGLTMAGVERLDAKTIAPAPVFAETCTWTGFYVGLHLGFGSGDSIWRDDFNGPELPAGHQSLEGVFGGGQLGYNFQFGHFVIGAEGDFAYSDVGGEKRIGFGPSDFDRINTDNDWTGTAAARLGYALADNRVLAYVKGGAAFSHWNYSWVSSNSTDSGVGSVNTYDTDDTRISPMVGVGVEFAITCHWSAKLEARYVFLGKENIVGTKFESADPPEPDETYQVDLRQVSAQVGLNYKF